MHRNNVPHTFHCAFWLNVMKCVYCPPRLNSEPLVQRLCFMSLSMPSVGHIKWHLHAGSFVRVEGKLLSAMLSLLLLLLLLWLLFIQRGHWYCVRVIHILLHWRHMLIKGEPKCKVHMWWMLLTAHCHHLTPHWPLWHYTQQSLLDRSQVLLWAWLREKAKNVINAYNRTHGLTSESHFNWEFCIVFK